MVCDKVFGCLGFGHNYKAILFTKQTFRQLIKAKMKLNLWGKLCWKQLGKMQLGLAGEEKVDIFVLILRNILKFCSLEDSENLKDKEREIREKLVLKLKKKAEGDVEHQQGKISKAKTDGFESVSDEDLSGALEDVSNEEAMEEISDDEMEDDDSDSEEDKISEIDSEEELRLTSTDDDSEKEAKKKKKHKKEKKDKKEKKKKGRDKEKERDRESRKERELKKQIHLAERIASRRSPVRREARADLWEHEKYDRERGRRERTPTGYYGAKDYYERRRRSQEREEREAAPMDEFERDEYERRKFMNSAKLKKVV